MPARDRFDNEDIPMLCEGDLVNIMTNSGEVIAGHIEIATNALWADVEVCAVVKRDNDDEQDARCVCGEQFNDNDERAEVVREGHHVLVHVGCMFPGEEVA